MSGSDVFNVTAAYDKAVYNKGDLMTLIITGGDVHTETVIVTQQPVTVHLLAANGATQTIQTPTVDVQVVTATPESVVMTSLDDPNGRTWTVTAGGINATGIA